MKLLYFRFSFGFLFSAIFLLGCQVTLAPAYDSAIVEKATENSELTMRFFASLDQSGEAATFHNREATYNHLIGAFESLKLQAKARPIPSGVALEKINALLESRGSGGITDNYPSAFAFGEIAKTLQKMKATDRSQGLKPFVIEAFKGQVIIYLDQALTYETFLKR